MTRDREDDGKRSQLRQQGCLNPHPERVTDPLFDHDAFFDRRDWLQVKYEMLRRVRQEGAGVTETAAAFGVSRPTFYQAQAAFAREGLIGLLPKKRGPREGHKLSGEVLAFLIAARQDDKTLSARQLADWVQARFGLTVHPRSIERVLAGVKKKRR